MNNLGWVLRRKRTFHKHGVNKFPKRQDNVFQRVFDICVV